MSTMTKKRLKKAKFMAKKGKLPYFRVFSTALVHQIRDFSCGPARTCPKIWWRRWRNIRRAVSGSGIRGKIEKVNEAKRDYRGGLWAFWAVPSKETNPWKKLNTQLFYQIELLKNGPSLVLSSSLSNRNHKQKYFFNSCEGFSR